MISRHTWKSGPFSRFFKLLPLHWKICDIQPAMSNLEPIIVCKFSMKLDRRFILGKLRHKIIIILRQNVIAYLTDWKDLYPLNQRLFTPSVNEPTYFHLFSCPVLQISKAIFCRSIVDAICQTCFKWHAWSTSVHCKRHQTYLPPYCSHNVPQNQHHKCFIESMK